jgi:2-methylisocitrate lyase-like PEP mutase family enzyme
VAREVPGPKLANLVEGGDTPLLAPKELEALGFKIAAHPLTLLEAAGRAMQDALADLRDGRAPERLLDFAELRALVGFPTYDAEQARYRADE